MLIYEGSATANLMHTNRRYLFKDSGQGRKFADDFRQILSGVYTQKELDEIIACSGEDMQFGNLAVAFLVGDHPEQRRIRNAYLPGITTLLKVSNEGAENITYTLFDNGEDAVTQIDRLVGKEGDG